VEEEEGLRLIVGLGFGFGFGFACISVSSVMATGGSALTAGHF
jgi:predicted transporter